MNSLATSNRTSGVGTSESPEVFLRSSPAKVNEEFGVLDQRAEYPATDQLTVYPTTLTLIVLIHVLFLYQWQRRVSRKRVVVTYQSIVRRKRFHKLWLALLSHPPGFAQELPVDVLESANPDWESDRRTVSPSVAMGNVDNDRSNPGNVFLHPVTRDVFEWGKRQWRLFTKGPLSGFPLLLYNSHILWSCRAIEEMYNLEDPWRYARCLIALTTMGVGIELCVSHALVQAVHRRQRSDSSTDALGDIQPNFDSALDPSFLGQLRQRVQNRTIGTLTTLSAAMLVVFRHEYTDIGVAVFPFLTDLFMSRHPTLAYFFCMAILAVLARYSHPVGVIAGAAVGMCWTVFSWEFVADAYHGTWMLLILVLLTSLSLKGESPAIVPCIEYVSWYDGETLAAMANEPMLRPRSWCFEPITSEDDDASTDGESDDNSHGHGAEEALLEFTRVRSSSDGSDSPPVDPDLLEQGRRPRRTRIQSRRQ